MSTKVFVLKRFPMTSHVFKLSYLESQHSPCQSKATGYDRITGCEAPPARAGDQKMTEANARHAGGTREVHGGECGNLKRE